MTELVDDLVWHVLAPDAVLSELDVDAASGLSDAEVAARTARYGNRACTESTAAGVLGRCARVRAPGRRACPSAAVRRPDADRAAGGRRRESLPAQGARDRHRADPAHLVQRRARSAAGGQGGRRRRRPAADDDRQGQGRCATASSQQIPAEQLVPGDVVAIEAGDVVPADGRLLRAATLEVAESALTGESLPVSKGVDAVAERRHAAGRPNRHGLHEHQRHPWFGRVRRHRDRHGHRGRPHLGDAAGAGRDQVAAHPPARPADQPDPVDRRRRPGRVDGDQPGPRATSSRLSSPRRWRSPIGALPGTCPRWSPPSWRPARRRWPRPARS